MQDQRISILSCFLCEFRQISKRGSSRGREFALVGLILGYGFVILFVAAIVYGHMAKSA
jgi:hypothetical protein